MKKIFKLIKLCDNNFLYYFYFYLLISIIDIIIQLYFPKFIVDQLLLDYKVITIIKNIFIFIILFVIIKFLKEIIGSRFNDRKIILTKNCNLIINQKSMKLPYYLLENKEFMDKLSSAIYGIKNYNALENAIENLKNILISIIIIFLSVFYLTKNAIELLIIVIITAILQLYFSKLLNKKLDLYFKNLYKINHKFDWFANIKNDLGFQKDIRVFQMKNFILDKMEINNKETIKIFLKMNDITANNNIIAKTINILTLTLNYFITGLKALGIIGNKISIGEFIFLNILISKLNNLIFELNSHIISFSQTINYLKPVFEIIDYNITDEWGKENLGKLFKIEFNNVSFKYPNNDNWILKNISFVINPNDTIGLVGLNGAGKTTLIKLLCGFYQITEGEIKFNNKNIKNYTYSSIIKEISAVFQDFSLFNFTIEENIVGQEEKNYFYLNNIINTLKLQNVFNLFNFKEKTVLGSQLDDEGIELSGGQQQLIATARALYKNSSVIIFDEPTSKLDPIIEYETYKIYKNSIKNKIVFFISHRMITTQFCDKILVLNDGKIEDFDTHENLMKKENSLYKKLYLFQQKQFKI